ncbi:MAG: hypothetical protein HC866_13150 [Leptolyngbyaceae cyanobacterium RU_5_1]|nr:hypothetical protein [Leptolyngbyaceae cyanobacterium RU_5_1]
MWRSLKNLFYSLKTYADLSPDLQMRRYVNRVLRDRRPSLSASQWYEKFWQPLDVSKPISDFVYTHMQDYSGLDFSKAYPSDRLNEDLHLPLVCWFDWQLSLCQDFWDCFGVDLSDRFNPEALFTVQELVLFLNYQLLSINHS